MVLQHLWIQQIFKKVLTSSSSAVKNEYDKTLKATKPMKDLDRNLKKIRISLKFLKTTPKVFSRDLNNSSLIFIFPSLIFRFLTYSGIQTIYAIVMLNIKYFIESLQSYLISPKAKWGRTAARRRKEIKECLNNVKQVFYYTIGVAQ